MKQPVFGSAVRRAGKTIEGSPNVYWAVVKRVLRAQKVTTTDVKSRMVYSAHSVMRAARPAPGEGDCKRYGNVQPLLEAFRPNWFDRCLPGLPKAARGDRRDLKGRGSPAKVEAVFLEGAR